MVDSSDVVAGTNAKATDYNNLRKDLMLAKGIRGTETDAATITIDWSSITKGKTRDVTLGGNRTIAFSNVTVDQWLILNIIQDATGGRTVTWPAGFVWDSGSAPVLSTTPSVIDTIVIHCTGAGAYRGYIAGMGLA